MKKKFFTYRQNNSGGYLVEDSSEGVGQYIIIEAENSADAWEKLNDIGNRVFGFWNYCSSCGEKWSSWDPDANEIPCTYSDTPTEPDLFGNIFVHFADGRIERHKESDLEWEEVKNAVKKRTISKTRR